MRGLHSRLLIAKYRIGLVIGLDAELNEEELHQACDSARALGYDDAAQDRDDSPVMFKNEPELLRCWNDGHRFHWQLRETQDCPSCQGSYDPCPVHG